LKLLSTKAMILHSYI